MNLDEPDHDRSQTARSTSDRRSGPSARTGLVAGVSAGLLGGAAAGLMFAVPGSTSAAVDDAASDAAAAAVAVAQVDDTDDATDTATETGTETDADRLASRTERVRTHLDELVDAGTITAEQADAVAAHLAEQAPDRGRHGPRGSHGPLGRFADGEILDLLGIDAETLRDELRGGATLAEVAEANGVSSDELIDALVARATERLDEAVANGRIDEDEAAEKIAELEERITERIASSADDDVDG